MTEPPPGSSLFCIANLFYTMKETAVLLVPLSEDDREAFIRDNQWAFKYDALLEFGEQDNHVDADGEIISRNTIERCMDHPAAETYRIVAGQKPVGGVILNINKETHRNSLEILFTLPDVHGRGIGYGAWKAIEALHPETEVWETCTPYFDKRNLHFYLNKCGFQIDRFWSRHFQPEPQGAEENGDPEEGPDEMFHFVKHMKPASSGGRSATGC